MLRPLNVATYQPVTLSAMEGLFHTEKGAPLAILGQPDMQTQKLENPLVIPDVLSFLTYRRWKAAVKGLDAYPQDQWPDNVPLLYYAYHNMVGLGSFFIAILVFALFALWRGWLYESRLLLWALMLLAPFPYIATTFGWMTAICRIRNGEQVSHSSRSGVRFPGGRHLMILAM